MHTLTNLTVHSLHLSDMSQRKSHESSHTFTHITICTAQGERQTADKIPQQCQHCYKLRYMPLHELSHFILYIPCGHYWSHERQKVCKLQKKKVHIKVRPLIYHQFLFLLLLPLPLVHST